MRKLLCISLGFAAGCGFCAYISPDSILPGLGLFGLAGIIAALFTKKLNRAMLVCLGGLLGVCWYGLFDGLFLAPLQAVDGTEAELSIRVTDYGWDTDYGTACDGEIMLEGKAYAIRFYLEENRYLTPGDTVTGSFYLRYTHGEEGATFHPGRGIFLLGYQREAVSVQPGEGDWQDVGAELAHWIKVRLSFLLSEEILAFSKALLLGDGTDLSYEVNTAFQLSGIRHIIAVSGLHVMLLYSLLSMVALRNRWLTAALCLPVLGVFAAAAGFTPSVVRASIMVALMILAKLFDREYDPLTALAFSALVMLLANPLVITAVSFQLTVASVAGIHLFGTPIRLRLQKALREEKGRPLLTLKGWLSSSLSITLGAMGLTTPLCALYFGCVSLVGMVTNLAVLWVVNLCFNGLILAVGLSLVSLKWAAVLGRLLEWPIRFVLAAAELLGGLEFAAVYTVSPYIVIWLVFVYLLLTVFLLGFRKRPGLLIFCAGLGLVLAVTASRLEPGLDECRATMLDVGQGQCILLQSGGESYLIDCGGDHGEDAADAAAELLLSQGIHTLDGVILTHWDSDHAGGLPLLLTRVGTRALYAPVPEGDAIPGCWVEETMEIPMEGGKITLFPGKYGEENNENSLCVLFETENCAILVTGDRSGEGELLLLLENELPKVDLLVAGHHGSRHSTSERLLDTVQPDTVLISAGEGNSFGHPAPELLLRLQAHGCRVYRTDLHGTIMFRR